MKLGSRTTPFVEPQIPDGVPEAFDVGLVVADAFFVVALFEDVLQMPWLVETSG